jgi:homoprotocatechuate degradation regulator HpaR
MNELIESLERESVGMRTFERSLPMALMRAREAVMRRFRPILAERDLTEQQWRVLRALHDADSAMSVGELAETTFLLGPSLSRMLVSLDDRGLIARTSVPEDARRAEIRITAIGIELVAEIAPRSELVYESIDQQLGSGDITELHDLLERVAQL